MTSIIEQAIQLEKAAESNYRAAAKETTDPGAAQILQLLADEEAKHVNALRSMDDSSDLAEGDLIARATAWVKGSVEGGQGAISHDASLLDTLNRAMDIEYRTETFYQEESERADNPKTAALFARLARIERGHYLFVGSLVEYFNRPAEWVEDAEFGLRDEY